jgi:NADH:ubiquinone oxidoreductase subunit 2 (subunit N)
MTADDLLALLPILVHGGLCIVTMLAIAVRRHHATIAVLAGGSCLLTLASLPVAAAVAPHAVTALVMVDGYALLYMGLLLAATLVVIALSYGYLQLHFEAHEEFEEFYLLVLLATFGGLVLVSARHFVSLFLGLELIGVSLYSLIGYLRIRRGPLEAALKYLLLSASASAFLLFGIALMYFQTGTMAFGRMGGALGVLFGLLAAASMIAGNVLALLQHNVKRLLAYSSIAHLGYLLVALLAGGSLALEAVTFYLIAYFIMTLGAFGIVTILSRESRDADMLEDYRGLFWSRPWLAGTLTLMLLSLAGIPVTVGFVGKFYAITAGLDARLWFLVLLLVANSAIGVYYYLRLIVAMFEQPVWIAGRPAVRVETRTGWTTVLSLGLMVSLLLWLGLYPEPMIDFIRIMVGPLASPVAAIPS